jgi:GH35 family endo-1,4-beta-xylanase
MKFAALVLLFLLSGTVFGARLPSGGDSVSFENEFLQWRVIGKERQAAFSELRSVKNMPFKQCIEVAVTNRTARGYDIMLSGGAIQGQIKKGDVLLCSFYARCLESSDESALGKFAVTSRAKHPSRWLHPFTKTYTVGEKWKQFLIPFKAPIANKEGYEVSFLFGGVKPQILQVADLKVTNYKGRRELADLPITETRYEGMEPDAPWRKSAAQRIEEHRKGDLQITVLNKYGKPVPDAKVHVELKNHAFGFGAALAVNAMFNKKSPSQSKQYQAAVEDLFNKAVFENRTKWKHFSPGDPQLEEAIAWCVERNIPLRGHCLIWPSWKWTPKKLHHYQEKPDELKPIIEERIRTAATAYPDTFVEWDVVNEPVPERDFMDLYGDDVVAEWFRIAKDANPDFTCYLNDYAVLAGYDEHKQQAYFDWIQKLLGQGAPLEGIGFQGHFRAPVPPEEILRRLDRFAEFGLEMQITEYDFEETDELLQARFTRDFMTAVFSHPQTVGIMTWCLWEDAAWKPSAAFYSSDWKKKRIALAWEHMIKKEWHTDKTVTTSDDGTAQVRGFLGDYEITVSYAGWKKKVPLTLDKGSNQIQISL